MFCECLFVFFFIYRISEQIGKKMYINTRKKALRKYSGELKSRKIKPM